MTDLGARKLHIMQIAGKESRGLWQTWADEAVTHADGRHKSESGVADLIRCGQKRLCPMQIEGSQSYSRPGRIAGMEAPLRFSCSAKSLGSSWRKV